MRFQYMLACFIVAGVCLFLSVDISAKELNNFEFDETLSKHKKYLFVFFYSVENCDNCPPLLLSWNKLEELIDSYPHSRLVIGHVNCDRFPKLCAREHVYTSDNATDEDEEDGKHSMRRPVLKLFMKRNEALSKLYFKQIFHVFQQGSSSVEKTDLTEISDERRITYQGKTIDLPNLELFLRHHLPKHVIEGSPTATDENEDKGEDDGFHRPNKGPIVLDVPKSFSDNTDLTDDDFAHFHAQGHNLVYFYTPTCELCQQLEENFEKVLDKLASVLSVRFSRVNCASQKVACEHYEVEDYPSLLWVTDGELRRRVKSPSFFRNMKLFLALIDALLEEFEQKPEKSEDDSDDDDDDDWKKLEYFREMYWRYSDVPRMLELNSENFYSALNGSGEEGSRVLPLAPLFFVHFTVPWSSHCKRMLFDWDQLHVSIASSEALYSLVRIARVDCSVNERLCNDEQVDNYPTIFLYVTGIRVDEYKSSSRKAKDFIKYLEPFISRVVDVLSFARDPSRTKDDSIEHRQTDEL